MKVATFVSGVAASYWWASFLQDGGAANLAAAVFCTISALTFAVLLGRKQ